MTLREALENRTIEKWQLMVNYDGTDETYPAESIPTEWLDQNVTEFRLYLSAMLVPDHHGIYVPKTFVENYDPHVWNVKEEDANVLEAGPDGQYYWETWDDVLGYAYYEAWRLYQDGDLYAEAEIDPETL